MIATDLVQSGESEWESAKSVYDFTVKDMDGQDVSLDKYRYVVTPSHDS